MGKRKLLKNTYFCLDNTNEHDKIASEVGDCKRIRATLSSSYERRTKTKRRRDFIEFRTNDFRKKKINFES